jgi:cytochrome c553
MQGTRCPIRSDFLAALPPETKPYGLDVYTSRCASCHGNLAQSVENNPPLRGLPPAVMQQKRLSFRAGKVQDAKAALMAQAVARVSDADIAAVPIYAGE